MMYVPNCKKSIKNRGLAFSRRSIQLAFAFFKAPVRLASAFRATFNSFLSALI